MKDSRVEELKAGTQKTTFSYYLEYTEAPNYKKAWKEKKKQRW